METGKKKLKKDDFFPCLIKRIKIRRHWFTQNTHIFQTHSFDAAYLIEFKFNSHLVQMNCCKIENSTYRPITLQTTIDYCVSVEIVQTEKCFTESCEA